MADRLLIPFAPRFGCGGVVTCIGARPGQAVFWELVSYDPAYPEVEYPSRGYLRLAVSKTDQASLAVNIYHAPDQIGQAQKLKWNTGRKWNSGLKWNGDPALADFNDRIRVRCDA